MCRRKQKYKRLSLGKIGEVKYDFILEKERKIYSYLSCHKMNEKDIKSLDDEFKFDSYKKWKAYVVEKYKDYDDEKLEELNRYLNLRIRKVKNSNLVWNLIMPVLLSIYLTIVFNSFVSVLTNYNIVLPEKFGWEMVMAILFYIFVMLVLVSIPTVTCCVYIKNSIEPLMKNDILRYMWIDYKEIIEEMIEQRRSKDFKILAQVSI